MSRCPTFTFQISIMSKWLAKHISNKVSFKFTIRKRRVYIDIGWPWIWNQYFYLGFWNDDRTEIIVLPSFQLVTRINSRNRNENEFINVIWHIILYMNIGISKWHNWIFDTRIWRFFTLLQFLSRILTSKYLKLFITSLVVRNGAMWKKVLFISWKCEKGNQMKHKTKCITDFLLTVMSSRMNDYTCHYEVST
jgi:hypothetical protein